MILRRAIVGVILLALVGTASPGRTQSTVDLTLRAAQEAARRNHPRAQAARLEAAASSDAVVQAKSPYFPHLFQQTVATVSNGPDRRPARVLAGAGLPPPPVPSRFAIGAMVDQLVTDFGRTQRLVDQSELMEKVSRADVAATDAQVVLAVTLSYFQLLEAQQVDRIAKDTLKARELVLQQVEALMNSGLRSSLDVSFAEVNVSEAKLLLIEAESRVSEARATLAAAMGYAEPGIFQARDEPMPPPLPDLAQALWQALEQRPDLRALKLRAQAARKFAEAERATMRPKLELTAGINYLVWINLSPNPYPSFNVLGGAVLDVPLFEGFELQARARRAQHQAKAANYYLTDAENASLRDVRVSWTAAKSAFESIAPAHERMEQTRRGLELSQSRYDVGLGSIVELTQAQLNLLRGLVGEVEARTLYQQRRAELDYYTGALR